MKDEGERRKFSLKRLREIAWEVGSFYPAAHSEDYLSLVMVNPHLGHAHWHIGDKSFEGLDPSFSLAPVALRIHDVTDLIFDGSNAHSRFDQSVGGKTGSCYFHMPQSSRNYICEVGLRRADGAFLPILRSDAVWFDRDRSSGNYQIGGMFSGGALGRIFPVENIFDAGVYERMNAEVAGMEISISPAAAVFLAGDMGGPLPSFVMEISRKIEGFGGRIGLFFTEGGGPLKSGAEDQAGISVAFSGKISAEHAASAFSIVHCHDWQASAEALAFARSYGLPFVFSLHSTGHDSAQQDRSSELFGLVCRSERDAVGAADLVIVSHSAIRRQVIDLYGADPGRVVIVADAVSDCDCRTVPSQPEAKRQFGLREDWPVVLFAGEVSHAAGTDILIDALPTVCRNHHSVQFVVAGTGPLKGELEARVWHMGLAGRCRFPGHLARERFEVLLEAADFVVIPSRTRLGEGLAQMAIDRFRPVLTTHQSGISSVSHGVNGLVTFDNPGSIVWGVQELLFNPLKEGMMRSRARRSAAEAPSAESAAAQYYMYYCMVLKDLMRRENG